MHRHHLLSQLIEYQPASKAEQRTLNCILTFIGQNATCFERALAEGHITSSAWLVNHRGDQVLLTHHRKLDKWCQLGGHCDGNEDTLAVARQEAIEESGIGNIRLLSERIFDLDIHLIPANANDPEHYHYDIRYLFQLNAPADYVVSAESFDLRWVSFQDSQQLALDESVRRMFHKWSNKQYYRSHPLAGCSASAG